MGGTISVIIKEDENTVHKMHRWTNSFPHFIKNIAFIKKDPKHLKEYLKTWNEMVEDYNTNKSSGKFKLNMTEVYVPDSGLIAPYEYGILYIDYVSNVIVSCQGYSSVDKIDLAGIGIALRQSKQDKDWANEVKNYQNLHDQKKLKLKSHDSKFNNKKLKSLLEKPDFLKTISELQDKRESFNEIFGLYFELDLSPFKVYSFADTKAGFKKTYEKISSFIDLSKEDEKAWKKYIKELYE
jgi:hypothetical protein